MAEIPLGCWMAKPHWPQESPLGWWEHPTAEGKLRLGSSDEVERRKGTQDGLPKAPKVGKAVLPLTLAPAIDLGSLKGSC